MSGYFLKTFCYILFQVFSSSLIHLSMWIMCPANWPKEFWWIKGAMSFPCQNSLQKIYISTISNVKMMSERVAVVGIHCIVKWTPYHIPGGRINFDRCITTMNTTYSFVPPLLQAFQCITQLWTYSLCTKLMIIVLMICTVDDRQMGHVTQVGHLSKTPLNLLEIHEIGSVDTFDLNNRITIQYQTCDLYIKSY